MTGLTQATLRPGTGPSTALYVKLTPDVVKALIESNGKNMKLCTGGDRIQLQVGDTMFSASAIAEASHVDLYSPTKQGGAECYENIGKISHRLSVQRQSVTTANLKSHTSVLQKEKEANRATLISEVPSKRGVTIKRTSTPPVAMTVASPSLSQSNIGSPRSVPGSPGVSKHHQPRTLPITSNKPLSSLSIVSAPMRVLHLLALGPNTVSVMSQRTNVPVDEVESIVHQYGRLKDNTGNNATGQLGKLYVLADNRYKDLRVWDWKHYTPAQRQSVIDDSIKAFDRLEYSADSVCRKNLIDPKVRKAKEAKEAREAKEAFEVREAKQLEEVREFREVEETKEARNSKEMGSRTSSSPSGLPELKTNGINSSKEPSLNSPASSYVSSSSAISAADSMYSTGSAKRVSNSAASTPRVTTPRATTPISVSSPRVTGQNSPISSDSPARKVGGLLKIKSPSPKKSASSSRHNVSDNMQNSSISNAAISNGSTISDKPRTKRKSEGLQSGRPSKKMAFDEDLFELARKFKDTYHEYAKLYAVLSKESKRPRSDVQRLLSMHKELESWKQRLWASQRKV